jgi:MerR family transcriptional regulator, thiopeptide resistance regulator
VQVDLEPAVEAQSWPVGAVASLAGVTVRTLHHYDRIGLVVPGTRTAAGYRQYSHPDVRRLQRVLAYRELGLSLDEIARLLDDPAADPLRMLRDQHTAISARIDRLRTIAAVLEETMEAQRMGINLTPGELLEVFGDEHPEQYATEAEERWGDSDPYRQSRQRTSSYTKDDWRRMKAEQEEIEERFAGLLRGGAVADSADAMDAALAHRELITRWFYDCPAERHTGLAQLYVTDPRFRDHYEQRAPGLARFVHDAIAAGAARS